MRKAVAYSIGGLVILFVVAFTTGCAVFAYLWGFNPLGLFPLYFLGLAICAAAIFMVRVAARN